MRESKSANVVVGRGYTVELRFLERTLLAETATIYVFFERY